MDIQRTFVIVGLQPWYTSIGSNCKHIAKTLSKTHKVLYVNAALDRKGMITNHQNEGVKKHIEVVKSGKSVVQKIDDNLWEFYPSTVLESINWLPVTWLFQKLNYINNKRFANDIKSAIAELNFTDFVLFNDNEIFRAFFLKDFLKPISYIYYCRDFLLGVDYWKKHGEVIEPLHIKKADFAMANSSYLANYLKKYNLNAFDIGQGCDTEMFDGNKNHHIPSDLAIIDGIKIGYVGALNSLRLDIKCLIKIAEERPQYQLILVGPEDDDFKSSKLHQLSNVHFLGQKSMTDLPAYIAGFDVCLNPQLINKVTIGNYPLKIDEYLNMGKPVVATKTEAMSIFEPYTYLADNETEYISLIEQALKEDSYELKIERMTFASAHTWTNCVNKLLKIIS